MLPPQRSALPDTEHEERLACLLEDVIRNLQEGRAPDLADYEQRYPELADQLDELLPSIQTLVDLGGSPSHLAPCDGGDSATSDVASQVRGTLGDFRLLRTLGQGGMGIVYEAEQLSLSRRVAVKVLPFVAVLDPKRLQRFKNEAIAAASLDHPNIVSVYSVGCDRGVHYFVMQYIDGQTLAETLQPVADPSRSPEKVTPPGRSLPPTTQAIAQGTTLEKEEMHGSMGRIQQIAAFGVQAADALAHAHQIGIIHRDIKPANLLVDTRGKLWVTDFGLAHVTTDAQLTVTGDVLGTLRYMSPEQASGCGTIDYRTDIYSLGATLYELLAGRPAFDRQDRAELLRQITETEPPPLCRLQDRLPVDLATIVSKAMERDAVDRYQTADALAADLRRFIENRPIQAVPPTRFQRGSKWIRRHQRLTALVTVLVLVACAGLALSTLLIARERSVAERNADQAEANLTLALNAMEETLSARVIGDLKGDQPLDRHEAALVERGITFYEKFARQNSVDPRTWPTYQRLLREKHLNVGLAHERKGEFPQAEAAYRAALREAEQLSAAHQDEPDYRQSLAFCYQRMADVLIQSGNRSEGQQFLEQGHALNVQLSNQYPDQARFRDALGAATYNLARQQMFFGDHAASEQSYLAALPLLKEAIAANPGTVTYRFALARCTYNLGHLLGSNGRPNEAQTTWNESLDLWRQLADDFPRNSEYRSRVGATLSNLAVLAKRSGSAEAALQLVEEAIVHQQRAVALEPVYHNANAFLKTHEALFARLSSTRQERGTMPFD